MEAMVIVFMLALLWATTTVMTAAVWIASFVVALVHRQRNRVVFPRATIHRRR